MQDQDSGAGLYLPGTLLLPLSLLDAQQLDLEVEVGVWRNSRGLSGFAIGKLAGDSKSAFAPDFHCRQPLVPTRDYSAEPEVYRLSSGGLIGVVEFSAVFKPADVMDRYRLPHLWAWSIADPEILDS